ncbi:hypothetical protein JCM3775_001578 [Rhodotorula graminis]|uniref:Major facilitator superfamily (MFS) profile domain-containing protein n=1 Tax=Rhodotorula graminis (strain WP1) TaxID=578459 RepID=A0A0N8PZ75_RHOGW|nr:uncharacterized protein RHOBADRAFT_56578 [Rhodotorula graminis WP1]KPV71541.1 hypothetical protein RHOBADRAFT_56578 [Rhodotorula graminis WP1]
MADKKLSVLQIENVNGVDAGNVSELQKEIDIIAALTPEEYAVEEKALVRKLDMRLMPVLWILLVLNYLDRNALASARVQGIEEDLGMKGTDFNVAISILFAAYIIGGIPANMILSRSRPSYFIAFFVALWGLVSLCTAFVKTRNQLYAVRVLLGLVEAPYFPGSVFLLSSWHKRSELALRTAILYTGSLLAGAFSGFISGGVQASLDGVRGLESWRWVFLIEGAITVFAAICAVFLLPDYPATTKSFTLRQRALAVYRLEVDAGSKDGEEQVGQLATLKAAVLDWRLWALCVITAAKTTASAFTQFIPTVMRDFHYSKTNTLLITAPPYVVAAIFSLVLSRLSDRKGQRCYFFVVPLAVGMIGFIIAAATLNTAARYVAIVLALCGLHGNFNILLAWYSGVFQRPRAKRAVAIGFINSFGNLAQIWSPYLYPKSDGPEYSIAFITNSVVAALAIALCLVLRFFLARDNARMDREEAELYGDDEKDAGSDGVSRMAPAQKQLRYVL